jgi:hypothetical protein
MIQKNTNGGRREGAGRPSGALNKLTQPVKALAASYGPASIARLVQLRDGAASEQVRFAAAKELLDRAYGRPRQEIDLHGDNSITVIVQRHTPTVLDAQPAASLRVEPPALMDYSAYDGESGEAS